MIKLAFFIILSLHLQGNETLYVAYGSKPQEELIIGYLDDRKEGFIKLDGGGTLKTEDTPIDKSYYLHRAVLSGLSPGQLVAFSLGYQKKLFKTRSLKEGDLTFVVAGDLYLAAKPFIEGIISMASQNPDFVVFGGDLAYTTNGPLHFPKENFARKRYQTFLKVLNRYLKNKAGEMIPIMTAIGNHDYRIEKDQLAFLLFFPPLAKSYFHYDLGKQLDLVILDTGHMAPVDGLQTSFLKQTLKKSQKPYKLAVYHVGAYPAFYGFETLRPKQIRENFCPEFDEYGVQLAFEHHSHAFKITHPLKNNTIDPEGTIYLGDGCVGVSPRKAKNKSAWYIEKAQALQNYYKLTLINGKLTVYPLSLKGQPIHQSLEIKSQIERLSVQ